MVTVKAKDPYKKLGKLVGKIEFAMLTTSDSDGNLRSRPMATSEIGFDGDLWFTTWKDSPKVEELQRDPRVNVSYAAPDQDRYVSISGHAELVEDPDKVHELWSPTMRAWFPKGKNDPNICLIRVKIDQAETWDKKTSRFIPLISLAKAAVTRKLRKAA